MKIIVTEWGGKLGQRQQFSVDTSVVRRAGQDALADHFESLAQTVRSQAPGAPAPRFAWVARRERIDIAIKDCPEGDFQHLFAPSSWSREVCELAASVKVLGHRDQGLDPLT